ncbi:hsp70 protein [Apiospora sp. TS-2023a]
MSTHLSHEFSSLGLSNEQSEDRVVIALDFGTTFSGVAYCFNHPGRKPEPQCINDWPGLEGCSQPKIPTVVSYGESGTYFKWGGQVDAGAISGNVARVKLLLDPKQQKPVYLPRSSRKTDLKELTKVGKQPVDVAADFMRAIHLHAMDKIKDKVPKQYFDMCQRQYVLTVPAVWSDQARDLTLRAAKMAGIHPVRMVTEPEAAAIYTLHMQERALKPGDVFLLCDCGGGTVDLITYEVKETEPYLKLAEAVEGSGGIAGSLMLNDKFAEVVKEVVGETQWITLKKTLGWAKAAKEWDRVIKPGFRGNLKDEHFIMFPQANLEDDEEVRLKDNCWTMTGEDVKSIFDPVIQDILRFVDDQVKSAQLKQAGADVTGNLLVGGFGSSQYLKGEIEKSFPDVQVIQPDDAWAAIAKGAVLTKLQGKLAPVVVSTQAVRHYGVCSMMEWDSSEDKDQERVLDKVSGKWRCRRMTWYILKGEELKRDSTVKFGFYRDVPVKSQSSAFEFRNELLMCDLPSAPNYPGDDVGVNCVLKTNLTDIDKSRFKTVTGVDGIQYYQVSFDLVLSTQDANVKFSFEFEGENRGEVTAEYDKVIN